MTRDLKDIKLHEVSLVDKAANQKEFLFFKQEGKKPAASKKLKKKINIVIDSDGTIKGTKIAVNGDELKNLRDFSFYFYSSDDISRAVSCSYSKFVETEDGFSRSETFHLTKGVIQMHQKIKEQLERYFGDGEEVDFEKAEESDAITKALTTVNEYKGEFPDELREAVGVISKQAGFCDTIVTKMLESKDKKGKKDDEESVEKAGAKLSKDTLKKIQDALVALKSILPDLKANTEKSASTDVEKALEEITTSIEKLEAKKSDDTKDKVVKAIEKLADRLAVVEKGTGIKKNIEGQENEDGFGDGKLWPSLSGG